ncbi:unnamed protein product [Cochlearia groenlandica]
MADSVLKEINCRPLKIPKLQKSSQDSKSSLKRRVLKFGDAEDDEYVRQYLLFYYQFEKTQGFKIDWEQFDYFMNSRSLDDGVGAPRISDRRTNDELVREATLFAIEKHNEAQGTNLVFMEHIEANFAFANGALYWLTFWARDSSPSSSSSSSAESKIYQAKVWRRGKQFKMPIFRLKPTDEEIESVDVQPPSPMRYEFDKPPISFLRAGPEDGVPFVFDRTGAGIDPDMFLPLFLP